MITLDSDYNSQDWNTFTSDTQIMLRYLAPISQIQQEKCIIIAKNLWNSPKYSQIITLLAIQDTYNRFYFCSIQPSSQQ